MPSVTSLDQDMRKLRLDRYTPGAANEVRSWIEATLGERLPDGDLMDVLRDGVALCKLVNLVISPGIRYKSSSMPFVQMENISHFLKACEMAPLSLPSHDRFLTVDLYDQKDPAQVIQCIAAFSRRANSIKPGVFPTTIGAKSKGSAMSPQGTGGSHTKSSSYTINTPPPKLEPQIAFNPLNRSAYSGRTSPTKQNSLGRGGLASPDSVSSWSNKDDEHKTAPAWNIHQYGYMGGASQGNQGVAFGARRQITSTAPEVPSLAEKEQRLQQREAEESQMRAQLAAQEEASAQAEEQRRWEMETEKLREREAQEQESKRLQNEEQVRREEQTRTERALEAKMVAQRTQQRQVSDSRLNGQFLSQYQASQPQEVTRRENPTTAQVPPPTSNAESQRIAELERQLQEMKEAERLRQQKEHEEQERSQPQEPMASAQNVRIVTNSGPTTSHEDDWDASERDYLKKQHQIYKEIEAEESTTSQAGSHNSTTRPLPSTGQISSKYAPNTNRTDRYLQSNPAPQQSTIPTHRADVFNTATEQDAEANRRIASQQKTKAGGWASKSLLEREMELERERQREWEEEQKRTASRTKDPDAGTNPGGAWDVHQYGYMGGDSQNRGGPGLGIGGPRRQIIGPRPPP